MGLPPRTRSGRWVGWGLPPRTRPGPAGGWAGRVGRWVCPCRPVGLPVPGGSAGGFARAGRGPARFAPPSGPLFRPGLPHRPARFAPPSGPLIRPTHRPARSGHAERPQPTHRPARLCRESHRPPTGRPGHAERPQPGQRPDGYRCERLRSLRSPDGYKCKRLRSLRSPQQINYRNNSGCRGGGVG